MSREIFETQQGRRPEDRRRYRRFDAPAITYKHSGPETFYQVLDLSLGGMRALSHRDWTQGSELEIELAVPDGFAIRLNAEVVWVRPLQVGGETTNEVGVRFKDLPDYVRARLISMLASDRT